MLELVITLPDILSAPSPVAILILSTLSARMMVSSPLPAVIRVSFAQLKMRLSPFPALTLPEETLIIIDEASAVP